MAQKISYAEAKRKKDIHSRTELFTCQNFQFALIKRQNSLTLKLLKLTQRLNSLQNSINANKLIFEIKLSLERRMCKY